MSTSTRIKRVIPVALYTVFYLLCFTYLENRHVRYHIIDSSLDDKIPFCEYFIIPYLLWFIYIAVTVGYFLFFNENTTEFWSLILARTPVMVVGGRSGLQGRSWSLHHFIGGNLAEPGKLEVEHVTDKILDLAADIGNQFGGLLRLDFDGLHLIAVNLGILFQTVQVDVVIVVRGAGLVLRLEITNFALDSNKIKYEVGSSKRRPTGRRRWRSRI